MNPCASLKGPKNDDRQTAQNSRAPRSQALITTTTVSANITDLQRLLRQYRMSADKVDDDCQCELCVEERRKREKLASILQAPNHHDTCFCESCREARKTRRISCSRRPPSATMSKEIKPTSTSSLVRPVHTNTKPDCCRKKPQAPPPSDDMDLEKLVDKKIDEVIKPLLLTLMKTEARQQPTRPKSGCPEGSGCGSRRFSATNNSDESSSPSEDDD